MAKPKTVIERAKSLLRLAADGSNIYEASIAAKRARALIDKHQLSIEDLVEGDGFATEAYGKARRFVPTWESSIAVAVAKYNDCQARFAFSDQGRKFLFMGVESDVKICIYMYAYLINNGKRLCSVYQKSRGWVKYNANKGTAYKDAYAREISNRLNDLSQERVEVSDNKSMISVKKQLVEERFGRVKYETSIKKSKNDLEFAIARAAGTKAARDTAIHRGIE